MKKIGEFHGSDVMESDAVPDDKIFFIPNPHQKNILDRVEKNIKNGEMPWGRRMGSRAYGKPFIGVDIGQGDDKSVVVHGIPDKNGGFKVIAIDEWSTWPEYKWWRNPIKWWKFRKIMKVMEKQSEKIPSNNSSR